MGYRTRSEALASIIQRTRTDKGKKKKRVFYDVFLGVDPYSGKPKRIQKNSLRKLKEAIERFYIEYRVGGDAAARLSPCEATDAKNALDLLAERGLRISLADIVQRFLLEEDRKSGGLPVEPPRPNRSAPFRRNGGEGCTVREAVLAFLDAQIGKSETYTRVLRSHLRAFAQDVGSERDVGSITCAEAVDSLTRRIVDRGNPATWKTFNNHLGDVKTFFNWCAKPQNKYVEYNPIIGVDKLAIAWKDPEYMKVDDVRRLFRVIVERGCRADLADAVLSFFCGMRVAEIDRIRDGEGAVKVDVGNAFIRVVKCKGATKGIRPRAFTVPPTALAWMRAFDFNAAIGERNEQFRRHLVEYAEIAGVKMPKNAGRHTFITMHAAAYHDPTLLSSIVGNSEGVRASCYDGVEVEMNGRAYFDITPQSCGLATGMA